MQKRVQQCKPVIMPIHRLNGRVIQIYETLSKHCHTSFVEFMRVYTRRIHLSIGKIKKSPRHCEEHSDVAIRFPINKFYDIMQPNLKFFQ